MNTNREGAHQYAEAFGNGSSGPRRKRIAMFAAGTSAMAFGLAKRGWLPKLLATGGGVLMYRSVMSEEPIQTYFVVSNTINKPVEEVFAFMRDSKNWPRLDADFEKSFQGSAVNGLAENDQELQLSHEVENRSLRWQIREIEGENEIGAQFSPAPGNRGTEVWIFAECSIPTSPVRKLFKMTAGSSAEQVAREHLRHCKQLLEAGEIPTTQGQPVGSRGIIRKAKRVMMREPAVEEEKRPSASTAEPISKQKLAAS